MPVEDLAPVIGVDESEPSRARLGETDFAWVDRGPTEKGREAALPLVLIHGFTGHRDDFIEVVPELARARRVIAPDLRGHGDSDANPGPYGWGFEQMVKDLVDLLDHLEIDRCDLFGHSMGGMLTLRFALAHPERIHSLIFMCTAPEVPETLSRKGFEVGASIAEAKGMQDLQALMEKAGRESCSPTIAGWGDDYWIHQRRRLRAMTPASFRGTGSALFDSASLVHRLKEIAAPTLSLVGEHDVDFVPGAALFEAQIPNVRRVTIADAEHHPHRENKAAFLSALETHLASVR